MQSSTTNQTTQVAPPSSPQVTAPIVKTPVTQPRDTNMMMKPTTTPYDLIQSQYGTGIYTNNLQSIAPQLKNINSPSNVLSYGLGNARVSNGNGNIITDIGNLNKRIISSGISITKTLNPFQLGENLASGVYQSGSQVQNLTNIQKSQSDTYSQSLDQYNKQSAIYDTQSKDYQNQLDKYNQQLTSYNSEIALTGKQPSAERTNNINQQYGVTVEKQNALTGTMGALGNAYGDIQTKYENVLQINKQLATETAKPTFLVGGITTPIYNSVGFVTGYGTNDIAKAVQPQQYLFASKEAYNNLQQDIKNNPTLTIQKSALNIGSTAPTIVNRAQTPYGNFVATHTYDEAKNFQNEVIRSSVNTALNFPREHPIQTVGLIATPYLFGALESTAGYVGGSAVLNIVGASENPLVRIYGTKLLTGAGQVASTGIKAGLGIAYAGDVINNLNKAGDNATQIGNVIGTTGAQVGLLGVGAYATSGIPKPFESNAEMVKSKLEVRKSTDFSSVKNIQQADAYIDLGYAQYKNPQIRAMNPINTLDFSNIKGITPESSSELQTYFSKNQPISYGSATMPQYANPSEVKTFDIVKGQPEDIDFFKTKMAEDLSKRTQQFTDEHLKIQRDLTQRSPYTLQPKDYIQSTETGKLTKNPYGSVISSAEQSGRLTSGLSTARLNEATGKMEFYRAGEDSLKILLQSDIAKGRGITDTTIENARTRALYGADNLPSNSFGGNAPKWAVKVGLLPENPTDIEFAGKNYLDKIKSIGESQSTSNSPSSILNNIKSPIVGSPISSLSQSNIKSFNSPSDLLSSISSPSPSSSAKSPISSPSIITSPSLPSPSFSSPSPSPSPESPSPISPSPSKSPYFNPSGYGFPSYSIGGMGGIGALTKGVKIKQKKKYTPSLFAIEKGVRVKYGSKEYKKLQSQKFTGLEIRPIIVSGNNNGVPRMKQNFKPHTASYGVPNTINKLLKKQSNSIKRKR